MSRPLRVSYPGAIYHVTARGNERKRIARDDQDRERFLAIVGGMVEQYQVLCHAWVLMDNHYHLVLETPQANLSSAIRHLNGVYTQAFNRRHQRVGHLFQGRFNAILVQQEAYLLELCRYVVLNPVRAKMVTQPKQWRWSSYRATSGEELAPPWLVTEWILGQFAPTARAARRAYVEFVASGMQQSESPWIALRHQIYLGNEDFIQKMQRQIGRPTDREIPVMQRQPSRPTLEEMVNRVATAYGVRVGELTRSTRRPSEARQVAVYAARRGAGVDLQAIAERFGMGYTGVSRRVGAVAQRLAEDHPFRARVEKLLKANVKT